MAAIQTGASRYIPDLRANHDQVLHLSNGNLYQKGNILQVWWRCDSLGNSFEKAEDGRETWTMPTIEQAVNCFGENETWED